MFQDFVTYICNGQVFLISGVKHMNGDFHEITGRIFAHKLIYVIFDISEIKCVRHHVN